VGMNTLSNLPTKYVAHWIVPPQFGHLQIVEILGKEREMVTKLIVQLALRGSYNLIAGDEWLPDRNTLYRLVRRYTLRIKETLDNPKIKRPMTCLQLLDLLIEADMQNRPTLILNFLHHFYNPDVELSLRVRTLAECCKYAKRISLSNPVVILVPRLSTKEFNQFLPMLIDIADEHIPVAEWVEMNASQDIFF